MSHLLLTSRLIRIAFWFWEWFAITKNYRAIHMILSRYLNITRTQTINISWILMGGKSSFNSYSQMMYITCIRKICQLEHVICHRTRTHAAVDHAEGKQYIQKEYKNCKILCLHWWSRHFYGRCNLWTSKCKIDYVGNSENF